MDHWTGGRIVHSRGFCDGAEERARHGAHCLAGRVVHALAQPRQVMEHPFDQPRIAIAVRFVQLLRVQELTEPEHTPVVGSHC